MNVALSVEFETFARAQVAAGAFASEEEVVAAALKAYLEDVHDLHAMVAEGFASIDRGEGLDGATFMRDLIVETRALHRL